MKNRLANLILALSATAIALVCGEVIVRWLDVSPRPLAALDVPSYQLSSSPVLGYEYRASLRVEDAAFDRSHHGFTTNADGQRDRERQVAKPPGTIRLIALGDSTTAGNGVKRREDVYTAILERVLNAHARDETPAEQTRYEVLNFGVGGYHTLQEAELLRLKGLKYQPDIVTLGVCLNDFALHADGGVYAALLRARALKQSERAGRRLASHPLARSRLAFVTYHRLAGLRAGQVFAGTPRNDGLLGRDPVTAGFDLLARLERQIGFKTLVFLLPGFDRSFATYRHGQLHRQAAQAAVRSGLDLVDLRSAFAAVDGDAVGFSWDGLHLNERGHSALAEILLNELGARGWLSLEGQ